VSAVTGLRLRHLRRYGEVGRLLLKYGRGDLVADADAAGPDEVPPKAAELADDLERLGATYIKLGQLL
jgi:predicted unusual protein kinase regulating ubiquinone biosynthesis (AarF/ABC1/UbiB family)